MSAKYIVVLTLNVCDSTLKIPLPEPEVPSSTTSEVWFQKKHRMITEVASLLDSFLSSLIPSLCELEERKYKTRIKNPEIN